MKPGVANPRGLEFDSTHAIFQNNIKLDLTISSNPLIHFSNELIHCTLS